MSNDWNLIDFWEKQCWDGDKFDYRKFTEGLIYDAAKIIHFNIVGQHKLFSNSGWQIAETARESLLKHHNLEITRISMGT